MQDSTKEQDVLLEAAREMRERSEVWYERSMAGTHCDENTRAWQGGEAIGWQRAAELLERKARDQEPTDEVK